LHDGTGRAVAPNVIQNQFRDLGGGAFRVVAKAVAVEFELVRAVRIDAGTRASSRLRNDSLNLRVTVVWFAG
jgi:hypothetical protein